MANNNDVTTTGTIRIPVDETMLTYIKAARFVGKLETLIFEEAIHPLEVLLALRNIVKNVDNFIPENADDDTTEQYERTWQVMENEMTSAARNVCRYLGLPADV